MNNNSEKFNLKEYTHSVFDKLAQNADIGYELYQEGKRDLETVFSTFTIDLFIYPEKRDYIYMLSITRYEPTKTCVKCPADRIVELFNNLGWPDEQIAVFKKHFSNSYDNKLYYEAAYPPIVVSLKARLTEPEEWLGNTVPFEVINFSPWLLKELGYTDKSTLDPI